MASWIIHLRIAQEILEKTKLENDKEFIMANIAPDSGIPNEEGSGFTPSKDVSHFLITDKLGNQEIEEDRFISKYLTEPQRSRYTKGQYTFYFGYLTHLITDKLWKRDIDSLAKEQFLELYTHNKEEFYNLIKEDWYDLDFLYLKKNPDFKAFRIYENIKGFKNNYLEFFGQDAFDKRKSFITNFYNEGVKTIKERKMHLSLEELDKFVVSAANEIIELTNVYLQEIYEI